MCFKKPKAPAKTREELQMEADAKAEREARKAELAAELARDKQMRLEEGAAMSRGMFGARSLISGSKGGAGFSLRSLIS